MSDEKRIVVDYTNIRVWTLEELKHEDMEHVVVPSEKYEQLMKQQNEIFKMLGELTNSQQELEQLYRKQYNCDKQ